MAITAHRRKPRRRDDVAVRISRTTDTKLQRLSEETSLPVAAIIDAAVEEYRRQRIFDQANEAYRALRADPDAWAAELEERRLWDATLMDGLEHDESACRRHEAKSGTT